MPRNPRSLIGELLITVGVLALALLAVVSVVRRGLFDPDTFADHLVQSFGDPRVARFAASRITDAVVSANPDLTAFRPLILGAAQGTVSSAPFGALLRTTARTAHAGVFSAGGRTVIVSVPDVGVLVRSALSHARPELAEKIPERAQGLLASLGQGRLDPAVLWAWRASSRSAWLGASLALGGLLGVLAGLALCADRRQGMVRLGGDLLVAATVLWLLLPAGRLLVASLPHDPLAGPAAAGLWDAFMGTLRTWALLLGAAGLVVEAAAWSLLERFEPRQVAERVGRWLMAPPASRGQAWLRAAVLLGAGVVLAFRPQGAVSLLTVMLGFALAFVGLRAVFDLVLGDAARAGAPAAPASTETRLRIAVVLALVVLFVGGLALSGTRQAIPPPRAQAGTCNGAAALCGRTLDQVVFPSTHNAMSAADIPDWLFPQQERGIPQQLADGVRGLLFDVHYGVPVQGRVKTDLDREVGSRAKLDEAVGKEGIDAAMRIRDRLTGEPEGPTRPYLCHGFCELGATPLVDSLRRIRDFLVENPEEVLVLVIEDYVTTQDLAAQFAESGLDELVYRGPAGSPWPTLRQLIDSRQRVLVTIESGRPGVPWLHPAFTVMQETPYSFKRPEDLSCAANRGGREGPLFLINNWIDTTPHPRPSNAALVNAYDTLLARARKCAQERGRRPNLIAVDFYRTGALFEVARTLNADPGREP